jgi:hypothetical protein
MSRNAEGATGAHGADVAPLQACQQTGGVLSGGAWPLGECSESQQGKRKKPSASNDHFVYSRPPGRQGLAEKYFSTEFAPRSIYLWIED